MLNNEIIVINTAAPLRKYMKRRPTHYAEILARTNRVINVSSAPIRDYSRSRMSCSWEERVFFRIPGRRSEAIQKLNRRLYGIFLARLVNSLPRKPILWHFYSGNYDVVKSLPRKLSVLEICDDTPEFFSDNPLKYKEVKQNEDNMARMVDLVFTISGNLKEKRTTIRPDIHVIRNGVAYEDFSSTLKSSCHQADELFNFKQPIVGYCGAVSKWFDFALVEGVAERLPHVNFVFVGRVSSEEKEAAKRLNTMANIHFLGERPYDTLPHYLKYFSLTQIPFVLNELVTSVNPIKLYEYLAAGKRVLSTPLPEVKLYRRNGIIETARNVDEYSDVLEKMLATDPGVGATACQAIAKQNTWRSRVEAACVQVQKKLSKHLRP